IFQSMINNSVTAPIIDMIPEMNCGKWSEIKSLTILVSLTTLLTVSPLAVLSKYVTGNRINRTQMLSRNAATTFCPTAANKYNDIPPMMACNIKAATIATIRGTLNDETEKSSTRFFVNMGTTSPVSVVI